MKAGLRGAILVRLHMQALRSALVALTAYPFGLAATACATEIHEIAVAGGEIVSIAIAPGGNGIAAGVEGLGKDADNPLSEVRWWNWNGTEGRQRRKDNSAPHALAWDRDGTLLAGGWALALRIPTLWWRRLGPGGAVIAECRAAPPHNDSVRAAPHGIVSIAPLPGGKVVTGGNDSTLAVWEGCKPLWLQSGMCCVGDRDVTVAARGDGFITFGEGGWQNDELGYKQLGPRQWLPSPWRAAPAEPRAQKPGLHADGESCSATLDAEGRLIVNGASSWTARFGKDTWERLAVARDCSAAAAATENRIVWGQSP